MDLHRWDRNNCSGRKAFEWVNVNNKRPDFLRVRSMANLIGRGLQQPTMQYYNPTNPRPTISLRAEHQVVRRPMERITNKDGETTRPSDGKKGGKGYAQGCLICRQYWDKQQNTNCWCSTCHMPLCNILRREVSCYQEHMDNFHDPVLSCIVKECHILSPEYKRYTKLVTATTIIPHPDHSNQHPALPQFGAETFGMQSAVTVHMAILKTVLMIRVATTAVLV